jgi:glycosyltransferase involved in cell wall biosynthesis
MRSKRHDVLLVDPKGLIGDVHSETFERHLKYSKLLFQLNPNARLVVFSRSPARKLVLFETNSLVLLNYFDSTGKVFKRSRYNSDALKSMNLEPELLIAGEPFETMFYTLILRKRFKMRIPIQVQIHFDPEQFKKSYGLIGKVKYSVMWLAILKSDSLRLVNPLQLRSIPSFLTRAKPLIVSPISTSVNLSREMVFPSNRPRNIGIFGRMHSERGLNTILKSLSILPFDSYDKIVIAGDGDLKDDFLEKLRCQVGEDRVVYLGHLNQESQGVFWAKIGVLISLPKFEAYGVSMREAICHGIPVIATRTIGSELLSTECPDGEVQILTNPLNVLELKRSLEIGFATEIDSEFRITCIKSSEDNQKSLVESWLRPSLH